MKLNNDSKVKMFVSLKNIVHSLCFECIDFIIDF
jgi:hypothetical protein